MDASDLATFAAVASAGALTRAAETLHTVQSNVTARLRRLEEELGVSLFHRHARGVILTSAGEQLLPYAIQVGQLLEEAKRAVTDRATPRGPLRLGSLETTAALRLPAILTAYNKECPGVDLMLSTGTTSALIEKVMAYELDGAFVSGPVGHPKLAETTICEEELVVISSPALTTLEEAVGKEEVKILVFHDGCSYRSRFEQWLRKRGVSRVRRLELGTVEGILGCAAAGLGITLLPRPLAERAWREGGIAVHALSGEPVMVPTMFVRRRDAFVSASLKRFVACAVAVSQAAACANAAGRRS